MICRMHMYGRTEGSLAGWPNRLTVWEWVDERHLCWSIGQALSVVGRLLRT